MLQRGLISCYIAYNSRAVEYYSRAVDYNSRAVDNK
jgi:hypothetical protein